MLGNITTCIKLLTVDFVLCFISTWEAMQLHAFFFKLFFSRALGKHCKPFLSWATCTSSEELLDLTWWLLQNLLLATG